MRRLQCIMRFVQHITYTLCFDEMPAPQARRLVKTRMQAKVYTMTWLSEQKEFPKFIPNSLPGHAWLWDFCFIRGEYLSMVFIANDIHAAAQTQQLHVQKLQAYYCCMLCTRCSSSALVARDVVEMALHLHTQISSWHHLWRALAWHSTWIDLIPPATSRILNALHAPTLSRHLKAPRFGIQNGSVKQLVHDGHMSPRHKNKSYKANLQEA